MGSYYAAGGGSKTVLPSSGYYMFTNAGAPGTNAALGNGTLRLHPFVNPEPLAITRIGCEVTSAGDVGSTIKLAIYSNGTDNRPSALLLDVGAVGTASTNLGNGLINGNSATVQEVTVAYTIPAGVVWIGGVIQGVTTTQPTMRIVPANGQTYLMPALSTIPTAGLATGTNWSQGSITGALPDPFVPATNPSTLAIRTFVKVA